MTLERLIADGKTPQKIVKRATIVLFVGAWARHQRDHSGGAGLEALRLAQAAGLHGGRRRAPVGPKAGKTRIRRLRNFELSPDFLLTSRRFVDIGQTQKDRPVGRSGR
jgi:hypothetical protein